MALTAPQSNVVKRIEARAKLAPGNNSSNTVLVLVVGAPPASRPPPPAWKAVNLDPRCHKCLNLAEAEAEAGGEERLRQNELAACGCAMGAGVRGCGVHGTGGRWTERLLGRRKVSESSICFISGWRKKTCIEPL